MHKQERLRYLQSLADARSTFLKQSAQMREAELKRLEQEINRKKQSDEYLILYAC